MPYGCSNPRELEHQSPNALIIFMISIGVLYTRLSENASAEVSVSRNSTLVLAEDSRDGTSSKNWSVAAEATPA